MKVNSKYFHVIFFMILMLLIPLFAFAGQIYVWTDENDQTYVSENEPADWESKQYEETEESKLIDMQRQREDAIKEAQIKAEEEERKSRRKIESQKRSSKTVTVSVKSRSGKKSYKDDAAIGVGRGVIGTETGDWYPTVGGGKIAINPETGDAMPIIGRH